MRSVIRKAAFVLTGVALLSVGFAGEARAAGWQLDKAHTEIGFAVKHLGVSKVRGKFTAYDATIAADADGKITSVTATAETKSVDTGIAKRDDHLRGDDFFNAEKFPTLTLKTKSVKFNGNAVTIEADLTMRDVTKPVTFTGEYLGATKANFGNGPQTHSGYSLKAKINRKDFGLKFNAIAEGVSVVADDVELLIEVEIIETK